MQTASSARTRYNSHVRPHSPQMAMPVSKSFM
jgi:hypothetical protein